PHGGVETRITGHETNGHHRGNGDEREADLIERLAVLPDQLQRTEAHHEPRNDGGDQDACAGESDPIELKDGGFGSGLYHYRRHALNQVMQAGDRNSDDGDFVERRLDRRQAPQEHDHAENDPGHPGMDHVTGAVPMPATRLATCFVALQTPDTFWMPDEQERGQPRHRTDG